MAELAVGRHLTARVDDDMVGSLSAFFWQSHEGYACRRQEDGSRVFLHHQVLGIQPDLAVRVDHIDTDPLNNQRSNLRVVTPSQNSQNRPKITSRGTYRGVSFKRGTGGRKDKWCARGTVNYRTFHIGYFETAEEAADAASKWRAENMTHSDADRVAV